MIMRKVLAVICLLSVGSPVVADPDDWSAGNQAYVEGNYELALQFFATAKNDGLDGPAVHYNLAVCNFKLGRYEESSALFQDIATKYPEMRGLAEYNLGLIARRQNDSESAIGHFLMAYRLSPSEPKLRILASSRLREMEPELRLPSEWTGAFSFRAGFDDNVALRDETGISPTSAAESPLVDFFASIKGPYYGSSGFRINGSIYAVRNFDASEFDQTEIFGGAMYDWRPGDWQLKIGLHASTGSLGGDNFDRKIGGDFTAIRYLDRFSEIGVTYVYDDIEAEDVSFDGITGSRQQFQARYRWYSKPRQFDVRLQQEVNDRLNASVSPQRKSISVKYGYQFDSGWGYEGRFTYRSSRFDEMVIPRDEDLLILSGAVTRSFGDSWLMLLEYQHANNGSSDPTYSYDRNVFSVGAIRSF